MDATKILIVMPNWVGDCVLATAFIEELVTLFPKAAISLLVRFPLGDLFKKDKRIKSIFSWSSKPGFFVQRWIESPIPDAIAREGFDLAFTLSRSWFARFLLWRSGAAIRVGFGSFLTRPWLNYPVSMPPIDEKMHQIDVYKLLLEPLKLQSKGALPSLEIDQNDRKEGMDFLERMRISQEHPILTIAPGATGGHAKIFPPQRFRELITQLLEKRPDLSILLVGDEKSRPLCAEIAQGFGPRVLAIAGQTSLRELLVILALSDVLVANDSGPMHMAAALGRPVVALFGPTDPIRTGPIGGEIIRAGAACSPCRLRKCPIDMRCMWQINVDKVVKMVLSHFR